MQQESCLSVAADQLGDLQALQCCVSCTWTGSFYPWASAASDANTSSSLLIWFDLPQYTIALSMLCCILQVG
jgi:hypothetical protein